MGKSIIPSPKSLYRKINEYSILKKFKLQLN